MSKDRGSIVRKLSRNELLDNAPEFIVNTHYEVIMGSFAYGVSNTTSDMDVYGVYSPPLTAIFPHIDGHIINFDDPPQTYPTFQKHHIQLLDKEYDVSLYSIVKYVALCRDNNPNMIDSLFVPSRCIVHSDTIGDILRENRRLFLHKGIHHKLKGYAFQQMKKIETKQNTPNLQNMCDFEERVGIQSKVDINTLVEELKQRGLYHEGLPQFQPHAVKFMSTELKKLTDEELLEYYNLYSALTEREQSRYLNGVDLKFMYHVVRLLQQSEQIMIEHDLDLERNRELLKSIRRGEWTLDELKDWFKKRESELDTLYINSDLRHSPDNVIIKRILMNCIEARYGSVDAYFNMDGSAEIMKEKLYRIRKLLREIFNE